MLRRCVVSFNSRLVCGNRITGGQEWSGSQSRDSEVGPGDRSRCGNMSRFQNKKEGENEHDVLMDNLSLNNRTASTIHIFSYIMQHTIFSTQSLLQNHSLSQYMSDILLPAKSLQSCLTLCNPRDCSLPGSSVHGNLQARLLEGVAMPSSRGYSRPKDWTYIFYISCIGRWVLYH